MSLIFSEAWSKIDSYGIFEYWNQVYEFVR